MFRKNRPTHPPGEVPHADSGAAPGGHAQPGDLPTQHTGGIETDLAWRSRIAAACGNDDALLDIARRAPTVGLRCEAVAAIIGEPVLKAAEREFRDHDRRVHRVAKQAYERTVATRRARQRADELIEAARALEAEVTIPTNRLVELDREWTALDATLLDAAQRDTYASLAGRLTRLTHERGEREAGLQRWMQAAQAALAALRRAGPPAAGGAADARQALADATDTAAALLDTAASAPGDGSIDASEAERAALERSLARAVEAAGHWQQRLQWLDEAEAEASATLHTAAADAAETADGSNAPDVAGAASEVSEAVAASAAGAAGAALATRAADATAATLVVATDEALARHWRALPPLDDEAMQQALERRFAACLAARAARRAPAPRHTSTSPAVKHTPAASARADALLQQGEAALAAGRLAQAQRHLHALDALFGKATTAPAGTPGTAAAEAAATGVMPTRAQHARWQSLQADFARLKGWQQWSGGRVRDDLLAEAEQLAAATTAAAADPAQAGQLPVKALADTVARLRERWKALDHQGGAGNHALWKRFSAALETAWQPVAAHHAELKARREDNLKARERLIAGVEAAGAAALAPDPAEPAAAPSDAPATWKARARALEHFQQAWRQLGPPEHTVPAASRKSLAARWQQAIERVEAPLREARAQAQAARERLIEQAQSLAGAAPGRETTHRLRELQHAWQQQARAMPLTRPAEAALWARFKSATDAYFGQREAAQRSRTAQHEREHAEREALLARLAALGPSTPEPQIRSELAAVDAQWRHAGELPRPSFAGLETRYRGARTAAENLLAGHARERWRAQCDALLAALEPRDCTRGGMQADAHADPQGKAHSPELPEAWRRALEARRARLDDAAAATPSPAGDIDALLLRIEMALDLPSPADQQQARRDLKLQAMKAALERGRPGQSGVDMVPPGDPLAAIALALAALPEEGTARARFAAIVGTLRAAGPR